MGSDLADEAGIFIGLHVAKYFNYEVGHLGHRLPYLPVETVVLDDKGHSGSESD